MLQLAQLCISMVKSCLCRLCSKMYLLEGINNEEELENNKNMLL